MRSYRVILLFLFVQSIFQASCVSGYDVNVTLATRWSGTPLALEGLEFLADVGVKEFKRGLEVLEAQRCASAQKAGECWGHVHNKLQRVLPASFHKLFTQHLATRHYSARLEAFRKLLFEESVPFIMAENACAVTLVDGSYVGGTTTLKSALDAASGDVSKGQNRAHLSIDHVIHAAEGKSAHTVVLYGCPGTTSFGSMHLAIQELLNQSDFDYIIRPMASGGCVESQDAAVSNWLSVGTAGPVNLAGYGIELVVKDTEYNQANDAPSRATAAPAAEHQQTVKQASSLTGHLESEQGSIEDISVEKLGKQTTQLILEAENPLASLAAITGRFPLVVRNISGIKVKSGLDRALEAQDSLIAPGDEFMLVNGVLMPVSDNINLATLESIIREDTKLADTLYAAGMHAVDVGNMLKLRALDRSSNTAIRLDLRSPHCLWLNDLEQDPQYRDWPSFLSSFLPSATSRYGTVPKVARNAINLQLAVDPFAPGIRHLLPEVLQLYMQSMPVRIGALFIVRDSAPGKQLTSHELFVRLFIALQNTFGPGMSWQFWYHAASAPAASSDQLMSEQPEQAAGALKFLKSKDVIRGVQSAEFKAIEDAATDHGAVLKNLGLRSGLHFAFNGKLFMHHGRQQEVLQEFYTQFENLQRKIASRELRDSTRDIYGRFLEEEGFSPVYSDLVLYSGSEDEGLNAAGVASEVPQFQMSSGALRFDKLQKAALTYIHAPGTRDNVKPVTMWLAIDLSRPDAAALMHNAATYLADKDAEMSRLSVLFNFAPNGSDKPDTLARFIKAVMSLSSRVNKIPPFLKSFSGNAELWQLLAHNGEAALDAAVAAAEEAGLNIVALKKALGDEGSCSLSRMKIIFRRMHAICDALGLERGQQAAITNGRLIVLPEGTIFSAEEFQLMQYVAYRLQPGQAVRRSLQDAQDNHRTSFQSSEGADELSSDAMSDLALLAASISARPTSLVSDGNEQRFSASNMRTSGMLQQIFLAPLPTRFTTSAGSTNVVPVIQAAINPVSTTGRQLSHLLYYLHKSLDAEVEVILNPEAEVSSMPLNAFYSFAEPQGPSVGGMGSTKAQLLKIPGNKVLTMSVEVPEAWLVEVTEADMDTDNLKLDDLGDAQGTEIKLELEAIMLTGSCIDTSFESSEGLHPRGTQLVLLNSELQPLQDTLVMSNLGYFQLKTVPGSWKLTLALGRSREMFDVVEGDIQALLQEDTNAEDAFSVIPSTSVLVHSLSGLHMRLLVRKKKEFKGEDLLQVADGEKQLAQEGEVVNIFAIASGHMYERLQKIMILSVLRHTNAKVKFWLIKNYMSPEMKRMMPLMAEKFGFEVEMVTYKWPSWLHRQTEKQRIIWAYKILFLDVLFPLNVNRIIFCDSDQIIRTDLAKLFHMDLEGKPVAYTPFCDNNKDMDGYRFWKKGFWETHLKGKPYHISALYLVDIARLRQMAAGDMYRVVYDRLSKDPGSLSNLDQDLPNYAQHQVPIYSLPQEWLWCESWCGTETKAKAKTIDLCNNPATKEPKLQAARRIVEEWPEYDAQVAAFTEEARKVLALGDAALGQAPAELRAMLGSESDTVAEVREEL